MPPAPPFRLIAERQPEQDLHEAAVDLFHRLVAPPAMWACYPAGATELGPAQMAKLSRMGLQRGWPDFLFLHRHLYGLELKRLGGRLSRTYVARTKRGSPRVLVGQEEVFPLLEAAGMQPIVICHSLDEVIATLQRWQIPLRGHLR
jgi:hypothetical protein